MSARSASSVATSGGAATVATASSSEMVRAWTGSPRPSLAVDPPRSRGDLHEPGLLAHGGKDTRGPGHARIIHRTFTRRLRGGLIPRPYNGGSTMSASRTKPRPRLLFSTAPFFRYPVREAFRHAAEAGFEAVEVMVTQDPPPR